MIIIYDIIKLLTQVIVFLESLLRAKYKNTKWICLKTKKDLYDLAGVPNIIFLP